MSFEFWLGLILAIPIGILTNIYTPKFEEILSGRNKELAKKRRIRLSKEQEEIEHYSKNRQEFFEYLIVTSLKAAFIGSISGLVSGSLFALASSTSLVLVFGLPYVSDLLQITRSLLSILGQLINLIGTLIVITIYREAFSKFEKVKGFNSGNSTSSIATTSSTSSPISNSNPQI
jgi:hypothetical protein